MVCPWLVLKTGLVLVYLSFGLQPILANELTVGRYSVLSTLPTRTQIDPLSSTVDVRLPQTVATVGEAVEHLLAASGYRLSEPTTAPAARADLLSLPLPAVHRDLGSVSLRTALEVLAVTGFVLVEDPVRRLVSFEPCDFNVGLE